MNGHVFLSCITLCLHGGPGSTSPGAMPGQTSWEGHAETILRPAHVLDSCRDRQQQQQPQTYKDQRHICLQPKRQLSMPKQCSTPYEKHTPYTSIHLPPASHGEMRFPLDQTRWCCSAGLARGTAGGAGSSGSRFPPTPARFMGTSVVVDGDSGGRFV